MAQSYPSIPSVRGSASRNLPHLVETVGRLINYTACTSENARVDILEVASGAGEHVMGFAEEWPRATFQPTERNVAGLSVLQEATNAKPLHNILSPRKLDLLGQITAACTTDGRSYDGLLAFNVLHCSPPETIDKLFELANQSLTPIGWVAIYGAFLRDDGEYFSHGDRQFDERFKALHPSFGLRRLPSIEDAARSHGFVLGLKQGMPAGNWFLAFERVTTRASIKDHPS